MAFAFKQCGLAFSPKSEQLDAIYAAVTGKDVFVKAASGFGKSVCFFTLPYVCNFLCHVMSCVICHRWLFAPFCTLCNFCGSIKSIIYLLRIKHLFSETYSLTWCQKWDRPSRHRILQVNTSNIYSKHTSIIQDSTTTWSIVSNHRRWIGLLREIFINVLNSSNRNANLSSRGRSTKSKRRKKRDCCCYRLAIKASKFTIRARGPTKAMTSRSLQLWRR